MTLVSGNSDANSGLGSYLTTVPGNRFSTLVPEMEADGNLSVSFVVLPYAQANAFFQAYKAQGYNIIDDQIQLMGGERRKIGRIDKDTTPEDVEEQLGDMLGKELCRMSLQKKSVDVPEDDSFFNRVKGTAASFVKFKERVGQLKARPVKHREYCHEPNKD